MPLPGCRTEGPGARVCYTPHRKYDSATGLSTLHHFTQIFPQRNSLGVRSPVGHLPPVLTSTLQIPPPHKEQRVCSLSLEPLARPVHSSESQSPGQWWPQRQLGPAGQVALRGAFALSQQLASLGVTQLPRHSLAQQRLSPRVRNETTTLSPTAGPEATLGNFLLCRPQKHERKGPNH